MRITELLQALIGLHFSVALSNSHTERKNQDNNVVIFEIQVKTTKSRILNLVQMNVSGKERQNYALQANFAQ